MVASRRGGKPGRTMVAFLIWGGCAAPAKDSASTEDTTTPADYSAAGPWTPATTEATFTAASSDLTLTVQVWYPSAEAGSGDPVLYDGLYEGAAFEGLAAQCDGPRPVLVFSHGNGGVRWQSAFLMEHLASHGYVVAAPDHLYNTVLDLDYDRLEEVVLRRPLDIADTFDWLIAQSDDAGSVLAGCIDAEGGYAVSGHSFGGYTTYATAGATLLHPTTRQELSLGDPRVWAALALSPWDAGGTLTDGTQDIQVPVMTLSGALDETTPWSMVSRLHGALTVEPRYLGELATAGHYSFAPISCLYLSGDGCGDGFLDLEIVTALTSTAALSFLEESLGNNADAIDQLPPQDDELTWDIHPSP